MKTGPLFLSPANHRPSARSSARKALTDAIAARTVITIKPPPKTQPHDFAFTRAVFSKFEQLRAAWEATYPGNHQGWVTFFPPERLTADRLQTALGALAGFFSLAGAKPFGQQTVKARQLLLSTGVYIGQSVGEASLLQGFVLTRKPVAITL